MKILELIQRTAEFFAKRGIEQPRLQIESLLAHALKKKRLDLYLEFERELDKKTLQRLREMVRRRAEGEPLQYIVGSVNFYGLELAVDKRALIPRPETEILVEAVWEKLKPQAETPGPQIQILDLCTGSGCIAVALAKHLSQARVVATDASADALALARENAARHGVAQRIEFRQGDLFSALAPDAGFHAIVSNPPYIAEGERKTLAREIREHEPMAALLAGPTGLEVIERILCDAPRFLLCSGLLALEVGKGQSTAVVEKMKQAAWGNIQTVKDLAGVERIVIGQMS